MERFDTTEVIKRAKDRLENEENDRYDILNNNCESFVNSCKCGLNVSLQVNKLHESGWEVAKVAGLAGSVVMSPLGPRGYASGGVAGVFLGHCLGEAFEICYKTAPKIKQFIYSGEGI